MKLFRANARELLMVILASIVASMVLAFCCLSNSGGFYRRYLDSDIPFSYILHDSTPTEWVPIIDESAQAWQREPSNYWEFVNGGFTFVSGVQFDGIDLVFFDLEGVNFGKGTNTIAFSATWTSGSGSGYHAVESDLVWNARDFTPGINNEPGLQDLQGVMSHEFGHHMGIGHAGPIGGPPGCGALLPQSTMYGTGAAGDTTARSLEPDDKSAAATIYPSWIYEGTITDASSGAALDGAGVISDNNFAGYLLGPAELIPGSSAYQVPGAAGTSIPSDDNGDFSAVVLEQVVDVEVEFFGYASAFSTVSFSDPGGIGETETITEDFALDASPDAQILGTVMTTDGLAVQADVVIYATSDKPGVPTDPVISTVTDSNGDFGASIPSGEDYQVLVFPESPYSNLVVDVTNLDVGGADLEFVAEVADIMIVDDDEGADYESYYENTLTSVNISWHSWDLEENGEPTTSDLAEYPRGIMVWFSGDGDGTTLTESEEALILGHLQAGGKLLLTGQNIAEQLTGGDLMNEMGLEFGQNVTLPILTGVDGTIGEGLVFSILGPDGADNQTSQETVIIANSVTSETFVQYGTNPAWGAAATYENGDTRAVHLGFGFEAVNSQETRDALMNVIMNFLDSDITSVGEKDPNSSIPQEFALHQNYPNPFNPETTVRFDVSQTSNIKIMIYNSLGQQIRVLTDNVYAPGSYETKWDGLDDRSEPVSSGVYFYRMTTPNSSSPVHKMLLMK